MNNSNHELITKRSENIKYFRNTDGSTTAAIYQKPVHYQKDGQWLDIDNTLKSVKDTDGTHLENTSNRLKVQFAPHSQAANLGRLQMDDYRIDWSLVTDHKAAVKSQKIDANLRPEDGTLDEANAASDTDAVTRSNRKPHEETLDENFYRKQNKARRKEMTMDNLMSSVVYPGICPDVDLEYILDAQTVKENLKLLSAEAPREFTFTYRTKGLTPIQEANEIFFKNAEDETIFIVRAPYMYDNDHDMTSQVALILTPVKNGWTITLKPDTAWLAAEHRAWPVIIDPVIITPTSQYEIKDNFVASGYPTDNYSMAHILKTGTYGAAGTNRSYMSFNLPALTSADMIVSAQMELTCYTGNNVQKQVNAHRVTQAWTATTLNWNNKPAYDPKVADYNLFSDTVGKIISFTITDIVKSWYTNGNNYGIMIKDCTEDGHYTEYLAADCDNSLASLRPHILISYVNYSGLESFWTYHSQSVGRAGTGYVNDYNGNLVFTHSTAQTIGNRMPASLTHVYNSNDKDLDLGYGYGFRLNYHQMIKSVTIGTIQYYEYIDEDGTRHYFYFNTEKQKWIDESGIDLTLTINSASADRYTITDKQDQKLIFNASGYLIKVVDANNNTLTVSWNNNRISFIDDGVNRSISLDYTSNLLTSVVSPSGTKTFTYTSNTLTSIKDVDNKTFSYAYNGQRLMITATNIDNYKVTYTYTASAPYRVTKVSETAGSTAGQSYSVVYGDNRNKFTDHKDRSEIYLFNNAGNTVSVQNDAGNAQSYKFITEGTNKNKLSQASKLQATAVQLIKNPNVTSLDNWGRFYTAGVNPSLNTNAANARIGSQSLQITASSVGNGYFGQIITLPREEPYVFSAYMKAPETMITNKICLLQARYINSAGAEQYIQSFTAIPADNGWYRMELPFTLPRTASSTEVCFFAGLQGGSGTVYYDCLQLEAGSVMSRYNLIENNDLRQGATGYTNSSTTMFDGVISLDNPSSGPKASIGQGKITTDVLNVRSGPGTGYTALTTVTLNTQVNIVGGANDSTGLLWHQIAFASGTAVYSGYVSSQYVNSTLAAVSVDRGIVWTDQLNVRSGAGTGYTALSLVTQNTQVDILKSITSSIGQLWYFIRYQYNGTWYCGCVLAEYVTTVANIGPAPVVTKAHGPLDANVVRLTGEGQKLKKMTQTVNVSGAAGDVFVANAWGASNTVPIRDNRSFGIEIAFVNTDGTTDYMTSLFGADSADWQYLSDAFVAKKAYSKILASYIYGYNANMAYFDGLSLHKEEFGQSFTYDANGNVISSQDAAKQKGSFEYDGNNNMKKLVDARGNSFNYTYDTRHNVTSAVSATNMKYTFGYDTYGNATQADIVNPANTGEFIRTKSTYTTDGSYLQSIVDALGNTVNYSYNTAKGMLTSMNDAKSKTIFYSYNMANQLSGVTKGVTIGGQVQAACSGYGYENDRLSVIVHNDFIYQMGYDGFGNRTSLSVAGQALATYVYAANNGTLINLAYGNGTTLVYNYDQLDRVTGVSMTWGSEIGTDLYTYTYNNEGSLALINDKVNNVTYRYFYDMTDRPVMTMDSLGNSFVYTYDANNNLAKMTAKSASGAVDTSYVYDDDNRETQTKAPSKTLTTAYDALGRVASRTWNTTTAFATTYDYKAGANGSQSGQLASITNKGQTISYNYDANGNITNIIDGNGTSTYYDDELNQLIREDNRALNKTVIYTYDAAGNIQSRKIYALTTSATITGDPQETINYTYDAIWRDKLTGYGNNVILYDNFGNPTHYCGWSMTWTQGRRLAYMDKGAGVSLGFAYNPDGIRTRKTDLLEGLEYHYQLAGDKIVGIRCQDMSSGSLIYENKFIYDSNGDVIAMRYSGTEYYYMKNAQRDVIGLVDAAGNVVVNYSYDSWGKLLSVTGNTTLGYRNPFRYRGYCADDETGFYLAGVRYYNPVVSRWISPEPNVDKGYFDDGAGLLAYNAYAYCANNPVNNFDPTGEFILACIIVCAIAGAVVGGAAGGTVAYNSAKSSGLSGSDLFWATTGGVVKGAVVGGVAGGLIGATGGTIAAYGINSVAATVMITSTLTIAARATEVTGLQVKKSASEGKNGWQIANNCFDSVFTNGGKIVGTVPLTKTASTSTMFLYKNITKYKAAPLGFNSYLKSVGGKVLSYSFAGFAWAQTVFSILRKDPAATALQRGYILK